MRNEYRLIPTHEEGYILQVKHVEEDQIWCFVALVPNEANAKRYIDQLERPIIELAA